MNSKADIPTLTTFPKLSMILDANKLDQLVQLERRALNQTRAKTQKSKPTVQMSVRMEEGEYLRFRALCKAQRRTNGDMVQQLMGLYLSTS